MNTKKLKEALVELQLERDKLDGVIGQLRTMIITAEPVADHDAIHPANIPRYMGSLSKTSYIEDAVKILGQVGKPMHVKEITAKIAELRKSKASRASVESSIARHISLGTHKAQLAKYGPSTYGLPAWEPIIKNPKNAIAPSFFSPDTPASKQ